MSISVGLFALILTAVFILGMVTTPLLLYVFLVSPAKIHSLVQKKSNR
jgi:hypothetical protein